MRGQLRVHPRGFAFVDGEDGASVFVPPPLVDGLLDADEVTAAAFGPPERLTADSVTLEARARTEVCATVLDDATAAPDPHLAHGTWALDANGLAVDAGDLAVGALVDGTLVTHEVVPAKDLPAQLRTRVLVRYQVRRDEEPAGPEARLEPIGPGARRRDLRDLTTLTIDADHSEDLDDALSVFPADPDGAVRVLVHISDVTEHLPQGSPLDLAAAAAGTSVYMPGWRRAMLPRSLSEGSLSLLPNVERDALTVEFRVDAAGEVTAADVFESRIRSDLRLSYTIVADALRGAPLDLADRLEGHPDPDAAAEDVEVALRWLRTAAARLGASRARRGGLDAHRVDPELVLDPAGAPAPLDEQGAAGAEHGDDAGAHTLIERLMVAANEAVAQWLSARGLPGVFRTHAAPGPDAAAELEEFCGQMGFAAGLGGELTPMALAALDAQFKLAGADVAARAWELMVAKMPPATYTTSPGEHFGLGSGAYLHFTAPVRRYADICVHRVVKSYLAGERDFAEHRERLEGIVEHLNATARAARRAENQLLRTLWMCVVADAHRKDPARAWCGRVTSVDDRGVRVVLENTAVWGRLRFSEMGGDWELTSPGAATCSDGRRVAVGELLRCTVAEVDPVATTLELASSTPVRRRRTRRRR